MTRFVFLSCAACLVACFLAPVGLSAQIVQGVQTPPTQAERSSPGEELNLVFEREVFVYPRMERGDPFLPLLNQDLTGPRFEEIALIGVMLSPNPDLSVAVFGLRGGGGQQGQATARAYRVRRGDQLGNVRILEILLTRVIVAVDEFGETQQHIMELQRPGQGGL